MLDDIRSAFSFLTILPLGFADERKAGWSLAWYPLVGLVIGGLLMLVAEVSPFTSGLTAFLVLFTWVFITGGLHLDGFSDSCDGLLATVAPERRLDIMKDPRTGSWAVIGLVLLLFGKWLAIQHIPLDLLILSPVMGRLAMVMGAYQFPYARKTGIGGFFRDGLGRNQVLIARLIALAVAYSVGMFQILIVPYVVVWVVGGWASKRLGGGITGDVYGALCELTELLCLLVIGAVYG